MRSTCSTKCLRWRCHWTCWSAWRKLARAVRRLVATSRANSSRQPERESGSTGWCCPRPRARPLNWPSCYRLSSPDAVVTETPTMHSTLSALQAQNAALRQLVVIHDRLGALVLQGADVSAITRMMADLVGRRVLLLDALLQVVALAVPAGLSAARFEWAPSQEYVRAVLATLARER